MPLSVGCDKGSSLRAPSIRSDTCLPLQEDASAVDCVCIHRLGAQKAIRFHTSNAHCPGVVCGSALPRCTAMLVASRRDLSNARQKFLKREPTSQNILYPIREGTSSGHTGTYLSKGSRVCLNCPGSEGRQHLHRMDRREDGISHPGRARSWCRVCMTVTLLRWIMIMGCLRQKLFTPTQRPPAGQVPRMQLRQDQSARHVITCWLPVHTLSAQQTPIPHHMSNLAPRGSTRPVNI